MPIAEADITSAANDAPTNNTSTYELQEVVVPSHDTAAAVAAEKEEEKKNNKNRKNGLYKKAEGWAKEHPLAASAVTGAPYMVIGGGIGYGFGKIH